ncbi:MAG: homocysteine S-methyltransferase family protein, partial [Clostridia bacterium]|nr:homocysteine S-methyltransferase family protein [Clostridia bacterium]
MEFLDRNGFVFLDGATGTMLRSLVPDFKGLPDLLSITAPEAVYTSHRRYIEAGSDIIYTNTFGATDEKLSGSGYTLEEVITASVEVAKRAAEGKAAVALDIGPTGKLMAPAGEMTFDEAYESYRRRAVLGEKAGADLIVLETMSDLSEVRCAFLAARENTSLPIFITMTFEANGRSFTGCSPRGFASLMTAMGADAVGINCSLGPDLIYPLIAEMAEVTDLPLIVKANAGLPSAEDGSYSVTAEDFAEKMGALADIGVKYLGGCCGTTPDYIRNVKETYSTLALKKREIERKCILGGGTKQINAEEITIVGERLNPTGKKKLAAALSEGDMAYVSAIAREQAAAGAGILDVNVGVPGADEPVLMKQVVETLLSVTDLPLQIDSKSPAAIEAGLRAYPGRAIINSVDGEDKTLDSILPLAKKYGAAVVGLTLDEKGIPADPEDRVKIAEKIKMRAEQYGIPACDLFIDCLTLAVSAEPEGARRTLDALAAVRERLGLKTTLGVSNISFGLPEREIISSNFLTLALSRGLTLPIINPCARRMTDAVYSYKALSGIDASCIDYVSYMGGKPAESASGAQVKKAPDLFESILAGDGASAAEAVAAVIKDKSSEEIINGVIIPALDKVGENFESGKFFLPQLMRSAEAANSAVEVIRSSMGESADTARGKIVIATVKGDIHDIGKNIVKMVLSNYGYEIIDLGKDVSPEAVVEAVLENSVSLVGLSALMTTT